jgi:3-deoxy-7-phosphoheptulonate synthase
MTKASDIEQEKVDDVRIVNIKPVLSPAEVHSLLPRNAEATHTVAQARRTIANIIHGRDSRLLVIMGPCSIHDPAAALDYAERLQGLRAQYQEKIYLVMRVYFEKPRTTVGWKGLINDPHLDESFDINEGLQQARRLLLTLAQRGLPAATEFLDVISPQYFADLVSWGAIGARTTESQIHRELASGLSCPIGFKNGTDGNLKIATDAIAAASRSHHFLSLTKEGQSAIFTTAGNRDCHVILRGGKTPNYQAPFIAEAKAVLESAGLPPRLMVDCSHANSQKNPENQLRVAEDIARQIRDGEQGILGVMVESHLLGGRQDLMPGQPLRYGQSITDACLSWSQSEDLIAILAA